MMPLPTVIARDLEQQPEEHDADGDLHDGEPVFAPRMERSSHEPSSSSSSIRALAVFRLWRRFSSSIAFFSRASW